MKPGKLSLSFLLILLFGVHGFLHAQKKQLPTIPHKNYCLAPGIGISKINNGYTSWYAWNLTIHSSYKKVYLNYNYSSQKEFQLFSKRFDNVTQIRSLTMGYKYSENFFSFLVGGGLADLRESQYLRSPGVNLGGNMFSSINSGKGSFNFGYSLVFESQLMITGENVGGYLRMFNMSGNASVPYGFSLGVVIGKLK